MTTRKSKPWRVIVTGPEVTAQSDHSSEDKAFTFVRVCLTGDTPADTARVEHWEDGRWRLFETTTKEDMG